MLKIDPTNKSCGAIISGIDFEKDFTDLEMKKVINAIYEYKFIYVSIMTVNPNSNGQYSDLGYFVLGETSGLINNLIPNATLYINQLSNQGWYMAEVLGSSILVFRKPIDE